MNKKEHKNQAERSSRRLWITLLFFCFTVTGFMQAANAVFAQATVTATFKNATLNEVLWEVQRPRRDFVAGQHIRHGERGEKCKSRKVDCES